MQALAAAREALVSVCVPAAPRSPEISAAAVVHGPSLPPAGSSWAGPSWQPKPLSWGAAPAVRGSQIAAAQPSDHHATQLMGSLRSADGSSGSSLTGHSSKHRHRDKDSNSHHHRQHKHSSPIASSADASEQRARGRDNRSECETNLLREDRESGSVKHEHRHRHSHRHSDERVSRSSHRH
jgi:hypothetical protein